MTSIEDLVREFLSEYGAKEINFHYPANLVAMLIVSYKYQKQSLSFAITKIESKLTRDATQKFVQTRFDASIGSNYNSCQPTSTAPTTPKPTNSDTLKSP